MRAYSGQSKKTAVLIVVIAGIIAVVALVLRNGQEKVKFQETDQLTAHPYQNQFYGFQVAIPDSWKTYGVREQNGADGEVVVIIGLPFQSKTLGEAVTMFEQGRSIFDLWRVHVFSPEHYDVLKGRCDNADYPCFFPIEVGRTGKYVIAEGQRSVPGSGWVPCVDEMIIKEDPDFCTRLEDGLRNGGSITVLKN